MKRWPKLHSVKLARLSELRAKSASKACIDNYYAKLDRILTLYDLKDGWLVVSGFNATLTAKVISWRSMTRICVSWLSHTSTNTTFLSKATDYFSHMLLQR